LRNFTLFAMRMLFFKKIYDTIIFVLVEKKQLTIKELYAEVIVTDSVSLSNFYKIIDEMVSWQMLLKEKKMVQIHARWIVEYLQLWEKMKNTYMASAHNKIDLNPWQQSSYSASSIHDIDGIWWDLVLAVNMKYWNHEPAYIYHSHAYYILGMYETEAGLFSSIDNLSERVYFMIGNDTVLDQYGTSLYSAIGMNALCTNDHPRLKEWFFINVIGDYVFELLYPPIIIQYFKIFFDTVKDISDFNPDLFHNIMKMKANCTLRVKNDPEQARKIKDIFHKSFGSTT
jgi:hypothetical protein